MTWWQRFEHLAMGRPAPERRLVADTRLAPAAVWVYRALMAVTVGWCAFMAIEYMHYAQRPAELYKPLTWFGRLFMPGFPPAWAYFGVLAGAAGLAAWGLVQPGGVWVRLGLLALLAYLNSLYHGYGHLAHSGHHFLLAHFLLAAVPLRTGHANDPGTAAATASALRWATFGLLLSYAWAGGWKLLSIIWNEWGGGAGGSWVAPDAMLQNATTAFWLEDIPVAEMPGLVRQTVLMQVSVWGMLLTQCLAWVGAFRVRWLLVVAVLLVGFHLLNTYLFHTVFWLAPCTVAAVLVPQWIIVGKSTRL